MTLARAIAAFAEEYEVLHHCETTRAYTRQVFKRFEAFVARERDAGDVLLDRVRRDDVEAYQRERAQVVTVRRTPISTAAVNRDLRELSTLFGWAVRKGATRVNPCEGVKALKGVKRIKRPLSKEEIAKLLPALPPVLADLMRLILNTGLRLGEALHLRAEDIDVAAKLLLVRSRPDYLIKDREEREIPLNEVALELARRRVLAAGGGLLFTTGNGTLIGTRNALRDLKVGCATAGVRAIDWYLLRHTFATFVARHVPPHVLKTLMGHSDVRTADRYYVHLRGADCPPPPVAAS